MNGIEAEYIIGDLPQSKRLQVLDSFKRGSLKCLVATDVAARGIDVTDLAMVINYDLPNESENYVHRIGRTARAGKSGKAYTFCCEQDVYNLPAIERYIEMSIPSTMAGEEQYAEDKSAGVYIRLDSHSDEYYGNKSGHDRGRTGKGSGKERFRSEHSDRRRGGRSGQNAERRSEKETKEELDNLAALPLEERMKHYREKFAGTQQRDDKTERAAAPRKGNGAKKSGKSRQYEQRRQNTSQRNTERQQPVQKKRDEIPVQQNTQKAVPPAEKKGFFAKLKAFFTGK